MTHMKQWLCYCIVHLCFTILKSFMNWVGELNALFLGFNVFTLKVGTVVLESKVRAMPPVVS